MRLATSLAALLALTLAAPAWAEPDWKAVGQALGKEGAVMPGGVYRVGLPRTDLKVTLDGVEIKPGFALGSWLAFRPMGNEAMVMGDLVLTGEEVNAVMKKLSESGIEVTALHNHLLRSQPFTMYMHVSGHGDPVKLAMALHDGLALSKTPMTTAAAVPASLNFDTAAVDATMGFKGKANGPVFQFSIPRAEPVKDAGMEVPEAMGSAIAINFQSTGGGKAAITGDFVLAAGEVNPVLKTLRANGIEVTAIHNHMLDDEPRMFFMHFWANDDAQKLAKGLRAALDHVKVGKAGP
jgi:biotin operon repressor